MKKIFKIIMSIVLINIVVNVIMKLVKKFVSKDVLDDLKNKFILMLKENGINLQEDKEEEVVDEDMQ